MKCNAWEAAASPATPPLGEGKSEKRIFAWRGLVKTHVMVFGLRGRVGGGGATDQLGDQIDIGPLEIVLFVRQESAIG